MWQRCSPANIGATSMLSAGWPHEHRCGIGVVGGAPDSRCGSGAAGGGTCFDADAGQMSVLMKARSPRVRRARPGRWPGGGSRRRLLPGHEHDHVAAVAFTPDTPSALRRAVRAAARRPRCGAPQVTHRLAAVALGVDEAYLWLDLLSMFRAGVRWRAGQNWSSFTRIGPPCRVRCGCVCWARLRSMWTCWCSAARSTRRRSHVLRRCCLRRPDAGRGSPVFRRSVFGGCRDPGPRGRNRRHSGGEDPVFAELLPLFGGGPGL